MIRFIDIRGRGTGYRFAFWDTTRDTFCTFAGSLAWSTRQDFSEDFNLNGGKFSDMVSTSGIARFLGHLPPWVDSDPTEAEEYF